MTATGLATTILFAASLAALGLLSIRLVSPIAPRGVERILAAAVVLAAIAVLQALALGLVGLGTAPLVLGPISLLLGLAGHLALPPPEASPRAELAGWWRGLEPAWRAAAGAAVAVFAAWSALGLIEPSLDVDSTLYHLPETVTWITAGTPGSQELIATGFPVTSYPVTNEVLLAWVGGLSRNMGFVLLWSPIAAALLLASVVAGARTVGARRGPAVLAAVALLGVPIVSDAATSVGTDLPAAAWVAVCVALCLRAGGAGGEPRLLAVAVVAFGLAIGTKTSVAPLGLIALGGALWAIRGRLPSLAVLAGSSTLAAAVGGVWYLRNFVDHGSPLWPFVKLPFGDPLPSGFSGIDTRFISQPLATVEGKLDEYVHTIGLGPVLIVVAIAVALAVRDRRVVAGSAIVAVGALLWMNAPFTGDAGGFAQDLFAVSTTRYLMPTIACAAGVLAVASSVGRGAGAWIATLTLIGVAAFGVVELALGRDGVPGIVPLVLAALAGALATRLRPPRMPSTPAPAWAVVAGVVTLCLAFYPGAFLERYSRSQGIEDPLNDTRATFGELAGWFDDQPDYREGSNRVSFQPSLIGPLAGGSFSHPTKLLPASATCSQVEAAVGEGWLVVNVPPTAFGPGPGAVACLEGTAPAESFATPDGGELQVFGEG